MQSKQQTSDDEESFFKTKVACVNTRAQKIAKLQNKDYRDAFIGSQISIGLPFQIRALREKRGWKQAQLATKTGMLQPRISAMESPGGAKFTIETLRRLASAFDVGLVVKFAPFSELVDWSDGFNPDTFAVPSFADDPGLSRSVNAMSYTAQVMKVSSCQIATPINLQKVTPAVDFVGAGNAYEGGVVIVEAKFNSHIVMKPPAIERTIIVNDQTAGGGY